jgi:hypothetical protein
LLKTSQARLKTSLRIHNLTFNRRTKLAKSFSVSNTRQLFKGIAMKTSRFSVSALSAATIILAALSANASAEEVTPFYVYGGLGSASTKLKSDASTPSKKNTERQRIQITTWLPNQ